MAGLNCNCMYQILGLNKEEIPPPEGPREEFLNTVCRMNRLALDHTRSTLENMRLKEKAYRMVEMSRLILTHEQIERLFLIQCSSGQIGHDCRIWQEVSQYLESRRLAQADRRQDRQPGGGVVANWLESCDPDSTS